MKTYTARFTGRRVGAQGVTSQYSASVFATNEDEALMRLYDHYEHLSNVEFKETQSPLDESGLVNRVQNTEEEHATFRKLALLLSHEMEQVAQRQAKDNADWHDDKDAVDHPLYHAAWGRQFPREIRNKAILEVIERHLEVISAEMEGVEQ